MRVNWPPMSLGLVAALLLAGCSGTAPPPTQPPVDLGDPVASAYSYACPPGGTAMRGEVCIARLASATESLQEPYVAVHPSDPSVFAIGVNAGHSAGAVDPSRPLGVDQIRYDVWFTEDGGATWRVSPVPAVAAPDAPTPLQLRVAGDPALAFDANGTLHASVLATQDSFNTGYAIAYTSTPDLGRTWSEPVVFTADDDNDRNWLTLDGARIFVPWQNLGSAFSSQVAWSLDGGATWRVQGPGQAVADCITVSPVVVADAPLLACTAWDDGAPQGIEVHTFDPETGDTRLRSSLAVPCLFPRLVQVPGALVVAADACEDGPTLSLMASTDGGRTWSEPAGPESALASPANLLWLEADPWGNVHLLAAEPAQGLGALAATLPSRGAEGTLVHLVLDATLGTVQETVLRPAHTVADSAIGGSAPDALPVSWGDHYYGLAFHQQGGVAAWTRDNGLELTLVAPVLGPSPPKSAAA